MLASIKYNFRHLLDFNGRDARQTFWYFVLFVYLVTVAISMVVMIPMMASMFSQVFAAAQQNADPETMNRMMRQSWAT